jgi:stress response protein SCP2
MAINLQKGQTINLEKDEFDLSTVTIGLGWDVKEERGGGGLLSKLFGGGGGAEADFDLDAIAFMLDAQGKVANIGDQKLVGGDVIFFNNLRHAGGNVYHTGDNRTGAGEGDDEQIVVKLNTLEPEYDRIVFLVSIYHGAENNQHFGKIQNAFIRAADAGGKEMCRYELSRDESFDGQRSMLFGELYRRNGGWKFRAIGTPYETDRFVDILRDKYMAGAKQI